MTAEERPNGRRATESSPLLGLEGFGTASADRLPATQVALLCFARLLEPIAFFSIFPYINQMVQANGGLADADVGFYSGLIESLFSLTQALVMLAWGRAADRWGRKPMLVASLAGMATATALFGLSTTIAQMIAFRCLAGVFAGTIVTIRTMLAEHSTTATQARVFSWFAFAGNLGIFVGPLLGGSLANIGLAKRDRGNETSFLAVYPYALPGFVVAGMGMLATVTTAFFVDETLPPPVSHDAETRTATVAGSSSSSLYSLVYAPGVAIVLAVYAHVMLLAFSYTAICPVFWFTPVRLGGFGFTPLQISLMMGVNGAAQAAWLLFVFPPLQHRIGTNGIMRLCGYAYPVFFAVCPAMALLLRAHMDTVFWVLAPPLFALGCGVSMSFTAVQLAVNDVAPEPHLLGTLNALALTGVSSIRAATPATFTSLFAAGAHTQWLHGYAIWVLMVALAFVYTVIAHYLPDYDALKKQREEEE